MGFHERLSFTLKTKMRSQKRSGLWLQIAVLTNNIKLPAYTHIEKTNHKTTDECLQCSVISTLNDLSAFAFASASAFFYLKTWIIHLNQVLLNAFMSKSSLNNAIYPQKKTIPKVLYVCLYVCAQNLRNRFYYNTMSRRPHWQLRPETHTRLTWVMMTVWRITVKPITAHQC